MIRIYWQFIDPTRSLKEKAIEKAVEKVRSDLRNQLDGVKNELAKAKADWAREKKRLQNEHESTLNSS